jgi:predicted transcriptional regulator
MDFLNKPYVRRGAPDSDIFIPVKVENGFVVFENSARCKEETFQADFVAAGPINESSAPVVDIINAETIDPDAFFLGSGEATKKLIMGQVDNTGQTAQPRTLNQPGGVVSTDGNPTPLANTMYENPYERAAAEDAIPGSTSIPAQQIPLTPAEVRLPEYDVFDRVKKSETIDINITFKLSLPRPEKLDAMNDLFETSFTAYLAKQYIKENLVKNPITIQLAIKDAIEEWMAEQLYGKTKPKLRAKAGAKKTATTTKPRKKPAAKKPVVLEETPSIPANDILSIFNQGAIVYTINNDEELVAMREKLIDLYDNNPQSDDIVIIEDVINEYTSR